MTVVSPAELKYETQGPRYDLNNEEMQVAVEGFLDANPPRDDQPFACYRVSGNDPAANIGRTIECKVFKEYFEDNTPDNMEQEYAPYEPASTFFISFDVVNRKPVGVLRIIEDSEAGMKTINDLTSGNVKSVKGKPIRLTKQEILADCGMTDLNDCWDVGTLAVLPEYTESRGQDGNAKVLLFRALYASAISANVKHLVSIIDNKAHTKLVKQLGVPFKHLARTPKISYMSSPASHAVHGYVPDFYPVMDRRRNSRFNFTAHAVRPFLERLMDGEKGTDQQLQFFSPEQITDILHKSVVKRRQRNVQN